MKIDAGPKVNLSNAKAVAKAEKEKRDNYLATAKHADFLAAMDKIQAPFGKAVGTGAHKSKKEFKRTKAKRGVDY
jgi:hypothetical protein